MSRGDPASDGTSYQRALHRMAALARFGMRPGLDSTFAALAAFDHPERAFPSLHVAGTNGKGSTSALAESMLRAAGATTGLYTSPHLQRFTERIRLGGREADPERVAAWLHRVLDDPRATGQHGAGADLTFFEVATVAAFAIFAEARVDAAVIECGLGGRLDATNTCVPFATVVTRIGLDHTDVLGPTIAHVAFEKAGIAKPGVPLVCGPLDDEAQAVVERRAAEVGAPILRWGRDLSVRILDGSDPGDTRFDYFGPGGPIESLSVSLPGAHQVENAALAIGAVSLAPERLRPDAHAIRRGLLQTTWPARLERVAPDLRLDGAHNPDGAAALARFLHGERDLTILIGLLADKDASGVLAPLLPVARNLVCTRPSSPRALPAADLAALARRLAPALPIFAEDDPALALALARSLPPATRSNTAASLVTPQILACGSLFLVGALRGLVLGEPSDPVPVSDPLSGVPAPKT